jgi:hypothetical protein
MDVEISMCLLHNYNRHYCLKYLKIVDCVGYYVEVLL